MTYVVEVEWVDYDGETTNDIYGPFTKRETADDFAMNVGERLAAIPVGQPDRSIWTRVRWVQPPRIRPIVAEGRKFMAPDDEEGDPYAFSTGQNSADHAMMR